MHECTVKTPVTPSWVGRVPRLKPGKHADGLPLHQVEYLCCKLTAGISSGSVKGGIQNGLHKVGEVLFGCIVGVLVSWLMSKLWLVRPPAERAN
jgi:hypothetical protein